MKTRTYAVILWLYVNAHVRGTALTAFILSAIALSTFKLP